MRKRALLGPFLAGGFLGGLIAGSTGMGRTGALVVRDGGNARALVQKLDGDGSALFFLNNSGHGRLQVAVYPETPALPFLGLGQDSADGSVKGLLRLAGGNHSGVVVIKDRPNADRIVMGLDMHGPDEEPFLVYSQGGQEKHLIGGRADLRH